MRGPGPRPRKKIGLWRVGLWRVRSWTGFPTHPTHP